MTFDRSSVPPMDVADRSVRLRAALGEAECDALLVTNVTNIRYLTGFTGSAAMLLVAADELVFVTDGRYRDQATNELAAALVDARIEIGRDADTQREVLAAASARAGVGRLGLESESVTWAQQRRFGDEWFPQVELVPTTGVVEGLREVKDAGEIARIGAASAMADAARPKPTWRSSSSGRCGGWAPKARRSRRSSRPAPTARCPTTGPAIGASPRATWSCSTSAPCSTATTPT